MLNLATNKEITSTRITQVPITDLVIRTVKELAAQDGMMPLKIENHTRTMLHNNNMLPGIDYEENVEPVTAGHDPLSYLVAFSFLVFLRGGSRKGEGKSNVLGIPLFLLLFLVLRLLLKVPEGTPNLRIIEGKGKAS